MNLSFTLTLLDLSCWCSLKLQCLVNHELFPFFSSFRAQLLFDSSGTASNPRILPTKLPVTHYFCVWTICKLTPADFHQFSLSHFNEIELRTPWESDGVKERSYVLDSHKRIQSLISFTCSGVSLDRQTHPPPRVSFLTYKIYVFQTS